MYKRKILKLASVISFSFVPIIISSCSALNNIVTKEEFDKIQPGMTYQEVIDVVGEKPTDDNSESWGAYVPTIWIWKNINGSRVDVSFDHGQVFSKSQKGL